MARELIHTYQQHDWFDLVRMNIPNLLIAAKPPARKPRLINNRGFVSLYSLLVHFVDLEPISRTKHRWLVYQ